MEHIKKLKKQTVFGLRTDHMSDEIYNHLERKARSKKFASYIIQLVTDDLAQRATFNAKKELLEVSKNQEQIMDTLKKITYTISNLQVVSTLNSPVSNVKREKPSLVDDSLKDVGQMGQLITSANVIGSLDKDDLEDPDF
jgi:hypothetical protein